MVRGAMMVAGFGEDRTMIIKVQVQAPLEWRVQQAARDGRLMAVCQPLGIAVEGESEEELQALIPEAIRLLMTDLVDDSEFDAFLEERSWSAVRVLTGDDLEFEIPWRLVRRGETALIS
jgi:predicted RNase H-like HicB family nuclease